MASGLMSTRVGPPSSSSVCCEQCTQDGTLIANCSFGCTWKAEERALKLQMRRLRSSCFRLVTSSGDANSEERQIATQLDGTLEALGSNFRGTPNSQVEQIAVPEKKRPSGDLTGL